MHACIASQSVSRCHKTIVQSCKIVFPTRSPVSNLTRRILYCVINSDSLSFPYSSTPLSYKQYTQINRRVCRRILRGSAKHKHFLFIQSSFFPLSIILLLPSVLFLQFFSSFCIVDLVHNLSSSVTDIYPRRLRFQRESRKTFLYPLSKHGRR